MKKLKKILLINWLYFSKEVIEVGDVNFLTGKNGAGKSTVIDALQIVLLGETNARNFNLAANERSQRTLDGYLRADMDENNPYSRRGKDFSTYIVCEFEDDVEHNSFVCGVMFDCRSDGSKHDHFFIYVGKLPENCFVEDGEAMDIHDLRKFLKQNFSRAEVYDTQWEYRRNMLSRWNVHNEQVLRMMKKAVSFRPIVDIQQFITENICDIPDKPDIEAHAAEHPQLQAARAAGAAAGGKADRAAGDQHAVPRNDALGGPLARAVLPCAVGAEGGHAGADRQPRAGKAKLPVRADRGGHRD